MKQKVLFAAIVLLATTALVLAQGDLHGSIDGMTPVEALDAVLPTCGLTHRVDAGTLHVQHLDGGSSGR